MGPETGNPLEVVQIFIFRIMFSAPPSLSLFSVSTEVSGADKDRPWE